MIEDFFGQKEIVNAAASELFFVVLAVVAGFMEWWGAFAGLALMCLLVPIWLAAVALGISAAAALSTTEGEGKDA